eukprot:Selendium_serpulae@DN1129_c0_g1_i1.p1
MRLKCADLVDYQSSTDTEPQRGIVVSAVARAVISCSTLANAGSLAELDRFEIDKDDPLVPIWNGEVGSLQVGNIVECLWEEHPYEAVVVKQKVKDDELLWLFKWLQYPDYDDFWLNEAQCSADLHVHRDKDSDKALAIFKQSHHTNGCDDAACPLRPKRHTRSRVQIPSKAVARVPQPSIAAPAKATREGESMTTASPVLMHAASGAREPLVRNPPSFRDPSYRVENATAVVTPIPTTEQMPRRLYESPVPVSSSSSHEGFNERVTGRLSYTPKPQFSARHGVNEKRVPTTLAISYPQATSSPVASPSSAPVHSRVQPSPPIDRGASSDDEISDCPTQRRGHEVKRSVRQNSPRNEDLRVYRTEMDGNCLFRAVSHQVYGDQRYQAKIRDYCMKYLELEADVFKPFCEEDIGDYIDRKSRDGEWGDDLEIQDAMDDGFPAQICWQAFDMSDPDVQDLTETCNILLDPLGPGTNRR